MSNWHQRHLDERTRGERIADDVAGYMGSWKFIIIQSAVVVVWMFANTVGFMFHWDIYPYILLNLVFSTQASYAAPIIMMAQNRSGERDRANAANDYEVNRANAAELKLLHQILDDQTKILKKLDNQHT